MKSILIGLAACIAFVTGALAESRPEPMQCMIGPVQHTFGSSNWLLYSCSDGKSLVVISDTGNPASPQYFVFSPHGDAYVLSGEGNGDQHVSDAAFQELRSLTPAQIVELVQQTKDAQATLAAPNN